MDEQDDLPDQTLSFVDVITNGLGSLLILFFLMVIVQKTLNWSAEPPAAPSPELPTNHPMMIMVRVIKPGATGFNPKAEQSPWQFTPNAKELGLADVRGINWDWGTDYALLLSPEPLSTTAKIMLDCDLKPQEVLVEIYYEGTKQVVAAEIEDAKLKVWPTNFKPVEKSNPTTGTEP